MYIYVFGLCLYKDWWETMAHPDVDIEADSLVKFLYHQYHTVKANFKRLDKYVKAL